MRGHSHLLRFGRSEGRDGGGGGGGGGAGSAAEAGLRKLVMGGVEEGGRKGPMPLMFQE